MTLDAATIGPALLFCPGERAERFEKAVAAADTAVLDVAAMLTTDARRDKCRIGARDITIRHG